ncbi:MAG: LuxR C-terminal-related transcriptional regulator [Pirellulaceae bacterium]
MTKNDSASRPAKVRDSMARLDPPAFDPGSIWNAISRTPGVGVSITDANGRLLFINDTAMVLFSESANVDYEGKTIADFHSAPFVAERLAMIRSVIEDGKPLSINHVYHGHRIESTVWPLRDKKPPNNRVIVVSHLQTNDQGCDIGAAPETIATKYIDLGRLDVLTRRELEVFVLLGHGLSVPKVAATLHRSPKTIQRHKAAISEKLHLRGQAELVSIVATAGLEVSDAHLRRLPSR